jgi:hypothetical protein
MHHVLQLDIQGTPQAWITPQEAALHYATGPHRLSRRPVGLSQTGLV